MWTMKLFIVHYKEKERKEISKTGIQEAWGNGLDNRKGLSGPRGYE